MMKIIVALILVMLAVSSALANSLILTKGAPPSGVPVNTSLPTISGTAQVAQTLTGTTGAWTLSPTSYAYLWTRAAPTPDVTNFTTPSGNIINVAGNPYTNLNANQTWSIQNPDTQTLRYEIRSGDAWAGDIAGRDRSFSDSPGTLFSVGTEVNVSFNVTFSASSPVRTVSTFFDYAQFHNNDVALGGNTSPPFEMDLQPNDQMNVAVGWLTANGAPSGQTFAYSTTANGIGISYGLAYQDPSNIVRGHTYAFRIQCKMDPTAGFLKVWRDGVQIANVSGPLGFGFQTYWAFGLYRPTSSDIQIAQFQNMIVSPGPYSLGTASTYSPIVGDIGYALTDAVTASNSSGASLPATSAATSAVIAAGSTFALPAYNDATANWQKAGLVAIGGIPTRSACNGTPLVPTGGDDYTLIQNAINACSPGQAVQLGPGTFLITMSESLLISKGITLRGNACTNGSSPYCQTYLKVSNGMLPTYAGGGQCGTDPAHIVACVYNAAIQMIPTGRFEQAWSGCLYSVSATGCSTALDADAAQGDTTVRVHSLANFSVGTWVRIDEAANASVQTDPSNAGGCVFAASDFTASSGSPATGKIAYAGCAGGSGSVENGAGYGALYDRETSEIHLVSAVGAGPCPGVNCTITFDSPLTIAYRQSGSHFAQVYWPTRQNGTPVPFVAQAGVENISISGATDTPIYMAFCAYCWISHVEAYNWSSGISVNNSVRGEIISSYIHDCADCENNGAEYPISVDGATTEFLVADNIIHFTGKGMVGRANGGGNVVTDNYQDDTFYMATVLGNYWVDMGVNGSHYTGSHHTLFEGNFGDNCDDDETHGNVVYHTFFRNWCTGVRTAFNDPSFSTPTSVTFNVSDELVDDASNSPVVGGRGFATGNAYPYAGGTGLQRAAAMMRWDYWMAFVGNVLGKSGVTTAGNGWAYQGFTESGHKIWIIGWSGAENPCGGGGGTCPDTLLNGTSGSYFLRHGNYDYFTTSINDWQTGMSHTLPNSFYRSSAPAYFSGASCTYPWPWVTPTSGTPLQTNSCGGSGLPAKARFDAGTPFVQP